MIAAPLLALVLAAPGAGAAFDARLAREWDAQLERNPVWASLQGDKRFARRWDDVRPAALARQAESDAALLRDWDKLDAAALTTDQKLTLALVRRATAEAIEAQKLGAPFLWMSYQQGLPEDAGHPPGVQALDELGPNLAFDDAADYDAWLARLETLPDYVAGVTELLRAGIHAGRLQPRIVVDRLVAILDAQLGKPPAESGFCEPFTRFPGRVPEAARGALTERGRGLVTSRVYPALKAFREFMAGEYRSVAPAEGGLGRQNGGALYAFLARTQTTTNLTPPQIHELGLREVARLRAEMESVKTQAGFSGTLPEFFAFLRSDPRFFDTDPQALLSGYRNIAKRIDPLLVKLFGRLPRMPYGVEPTPEATAPSATTGFYFPAAPDGSRPGTYIVNLYKPEARPKWEMVPLTLHEAVPGHHLQVSLAAEAEGLPAFRRITYYMAFGEGWGLYSEWLGYELGLYSDPYDHFGQLTFEMWRAVRLVVDTGMHEDGWTRERAIAYFKENSPRADLDIENEVDRYLAIPGQALAYKIGQMKILELRRRAEAALGPRFDVRAYHDEVLGSGSLPLDALETRIDAWIAKASSAPAKPPAAR